MFEYCVTLFMDEPRVKFELFVLAEGLDMLLRQCTVMALADVQ